MFCLLVVLLGLYGASSATVLPCPVDKGPMPKSVTIEECDAPDNCELIRGKHFKADVQFTARETRFCCFQSEKLKLFIPS